jgi:hypothetical protein
MREYTSRNGDRLMTTPSIFRRWNDLPYGIWTCADGREVLFNRFYEPLWERSPAFAARAANPAERVPAVRQDWFYTHSGNGRGEGDYRRAGEAVLTAWGIAIPPARTVRDGRLL